MLCRCVDVVQGANPEASGMYYSTPNSEWEVLGSFQSGGEIEMEVVVGVYHYVREREDPPHRSVEKDCLTHFLLVEEYNLNMDRDHEMWTRQRTIHFPRLDKIAR